MKKINASMRVATAMLVASLSLVGLSGCNSKPELRRVSPQAADQPINTPETAAKLKQQRPE